MRDKFPLYDDNGINLADPYDKKGLKTNYISILQREAVKKYVGASKGAALDVGCGYGRMAKCLGELGFSVTGVEPSERVLEAAKKHQPEHKWYVGELPNLPVPKGNYDLVCLFNVARALHLMNILGVCETLPDYVRNGGRMVIIDNVKLSDNRYIPEEWYSNFFSKNDMRLVLKKPIRASRWPIIYMIRYGLIPESWFEMIAKWELEKMSKKTKIPKFSYYNYIYIFEKDKV